MKTFLEFTEELEKKGDDEITIPAPLTIKQRMQKRRTMFLNKSKIQLGKRRSDKRRASNDTLEQRAKRRARDAMEKKVRPSVNKDELDYPQRAPLEKQVNTIARLKLMRIQEPIHFRAARADEIERKSNPQK